MDNSLTLSYLSLLLLLLAVASFFILRQVIRTRRTESTLSRLQNTLKGGQGSAKDHYELGGIYLDKRLFSQAVVQFQKALKAKDLEGEENTALIYNGLGYAHAAQEQYDIAIRQYKEALKLKPDYVVAFNNLGFAYEKKQLSAQALEAYESALALEPNNPTAKRRVEPLRKLFAPSAS